MGHRVLSLVYPCRKTILGDANQSVSPLSSSDSQIITDIVPKSRAVTLNKSYRSTVEITHFSLRVRPNPDIVPVERHGQEPAVHACADETEQTALIKKWLREFLDSERQSLGIVCKTQKQAAALHKNLKSFHDDIHLLDATATHFDGGVILATAHLLKGLEFDEVIIPETDAENYRTSIDRQMLYVGCTRAMHLLRLTHLGEPTRLLTSGNAGSKREDPKEGGA